MNHNQQSGDAKNDDDSALSDFLASLMDYTPAIPDELVEHYLAKSGFQCPDVRLIRLVAVATQKFVAEVASDALHYFFRCKGNITEMGIARQGRLQSSKTKGRSSKRIST
ncbi:transcription initiation factor TFIID subunit 10-like isoform X4 [Durio zibethinus]|uniref:Transcription initiation factor TFIID subunit 10-like isoform X4 n=1 Tax=Durio zibethinus TaxID=66656 RepID=A0A6P5ZNP7_DURZI|nr:transcription initiation factor TFIID subunit 10-like isoform X4 [Durio zibethinus]XP_022754440.1 transcription initiation factor TFIID subunit 10-like isoform X4 [Durio zibethinus]